MASDGSINHTDFGWRKSRAAKAFAGTWMIIRGAMAVLLFAGIVLACIPLMPAFPGPGGDPAWEYAMNEAVALMAVAFGAALLLLNRRNLIYLLPVPAIIPLVTVQLKAPRRLGFALWAQFASLPGG